MSLKEELIALSKMTPEQVKAAKKAKKRQELEAQGYTFRQSGGLVIGTAPKVSTALIMSDEERAAAIARKNAGKWGEQAQPGGGLSLGGNSEYGGSSGAPRAATSAPANGGVPTTTVTPETQESPVLASALTTGSAPYSTTGRTSTGASAATGGRTQTTAAAKPEPKTGLLLAAITAGFYLL